MPITRTPLRNGSNRATYTRVMGRHTLKIGAMERSPFLNFFQPSAFTAPFGVDFTQGPRPPGGIFSGR